MADNTGNPFDEIASSGENSSQNSGQTPTQNANQNFSNSQTQNSQPTQQTSNQPTGQNPTQNSSQNSGQNFSQNSAQNPTPQNSQPTQQTSSQPTEQNSEQTSSQNSQPQPAAAPQNLSDLQKSEENPEQKSEKNPPQNSAQIFSQNPTQQNPASSAAFSANPNQPPQNSDQKVSPENSSQNFSSQNSQKNDDRENPATAGLDPTKIPAAQNPKPQPAVNPNPPQNFSTQNPYSQNTPAQNPPKNDLNLDDIRNQPSGNGSDDTPPPAQPANPQPKPHKKSGGIFRIIWLVLGLLILVGFMIFTMFPREIAAIFWGNSSPKPNNTVTSSSKKLTGSSLENSLLFEGEIPPETTTAPESLDSDQIEPTPSTGQNRTGNSAENQPTQEIEENSDESADDRDQILFGESSTGETTENIEENIEEAIEENIENTPTNTVEIDTTTRESYKSQGEEIFANGRLIRDSTMIREWLFIQKKSTEVLDAHAAGTLTESQKSDTETAILEFLEKHQNAPTNSTTE